MTESRPRVRTQKSLISPASPAVTEVMTKQRSLTTLEGATVCFWHDSTPEADVVFPVVRDYLMTQGVAEVLLAKQPAPASRPQEYNLALARRSDAAVLGVAW